MVRKSLLRCPARSHQMKLMARPYRRQPIVRVIPHERKRSSLRKNVIRAKKQRVHMENIQTIGYVDEEYMAMIHTEAKHEEMKRIPKAREAVDDEWDKPFKMGAFGLKQFEPMDQDKKRYDKDKKLVRFGNLRAN